MHLKAVITAFPSVFLPFLAVPLPSQRTVGARLGIVTAGMLWTAISLDR
eukprot:SAG22_NODE_1287_length_4872_cov_2.731615_4_plen_49_part_00